MKDTGELKDIARQVANEVVDTRLQDQLSTVEKMIDAKMQPVTEQLTIIDATLLEYKISVDALVKQGQELAAAALEMRGALTIVNKLPDDMKRLNENMQETEKSLLTVEQESTELRHDIFGNGSVPPELTLHGMVKGIYAGIAEQKEALDKLDSRLQLVEQFKETAEMIMSASANVVKRSGRGLFDLFKKYRLLVYAAGIVGGIAQWVDDESISQIIDVIVAAIAGAPIE